MSETPINTLLDLSEKKQGKQKKEKHFEKAEYHRHCAKVRFFKQR